MADQYVRTNEDVVQRTYNEASALTVRTGKALFRGVILTAGSDVATLIIYDNTDATDAATKQYTVKTAANTTRVVMHPWLKMTTGIHITLAGTSPNCSVLFTPMKNA